MREWVIKKRNSQESLKTLGRRFDIEMIRSVSLGKVY